MGHQSTYRPRAARAALLALGTALLCLSLASQALGASPSHPRLKAQDLTGLNHACGVAVDSKGDAYASSAGESKVNVYDPAHNLLTSVTDANEPCGLAVTTTGVLYVSEKATGEVVQFKPNAYPFSGTPTYGSREVIDASTKAKGIAVDPYDDALYVAEGTRVAAYVHELQTLALENVVTGGTFKLKFGGEETPSLPYNATAAEVQGALAALSTIGAGNVEVAKHPSSWSVFFTGKFAYTDVAGTIERDYSLLTGTNPRLGVIETAKGFSGQIGEGVLAEATGVAAYANPLSAQAADRYLWVADAKGLAPDSLLLFGGPTASTLKPRRELSGTTTPDGSFGFGAQGAYLAADSGNRGAEGKCLPVGEQACTAGHLFLYDSLHKALDEFDATGEYLGQTTNAAFADAEPSAVAIDRSGGAGDGTLYVTAGSGAGAKALAFGPLKAPARATLGEPLSHLLAGAEAVATDSRGYVYAGFGPFISVYKPDGTELFRTRPSDGKHLPLIEDKGAPIDLAVDSTGKVYVIDEKNEKKEEKAVVSYYTPETYPPVSATPYTRRATPIATPEDFVSIENSSKVPRAIAINPGPGPGKDRLFVTAQAVTHEYDSAANESKLLNPAFAPGVGGSGRESLAVNGANGNVYFGINNNTPLITVVSPDGKEVLARINEAGGPKGPGGPSPRVAVDQSNGHVLVFDGIRSAAREYDASGGFVAEFGNFTEGLSKGYRVAVDSACALHEPKLTGKACEEFDPANGTFYVAFDDTNPSHPPYDVSAFGPLSYPEVGEPPVAVTGIADEFGPGAATLHGTVDPKGSLLGECKFEYLSEAEYETNGKTFAGAEAKACAESPAEIGTGSKPVPVHAHLEGLTETPYRFRLVASNVGGKSEGEAVLFGPPQIEALSPLPILYHEAKLRAKVNPSGLASEYRFDFVDAKSFEEQGGFEGPETRHSPWTKLAAGEEAVPVSAAIVGLTEGTAYRYRAVAKNAAATTEEPTQSFVTQIHRGAEECANGAYRFGLSAALPDCRAYELVTPAETNGLSPGTADGGTSPSGVSVNDWLTPQRGEAAGKRLSYFTEGTLPGFEGNGRSDGYRAERDSGEHPSEGWQSELFSPDYLQSFNSLMPQLGIASDQLYSAWEIDTAKAESPPPSGTLPEGVYLRTPAGFEPMAKGSLGTDLQALSRYVSPGGAHVIFVSRAHLEPDAPPAPVRALYDRPAGKSSATVISAPPVGASPSLEAQFESSDAEYAGASEDGSAVAFTLGGTLYLHREGQTFAIGGGNFAGISEDGKRVFYGGGESPVALYACDTEAGSCAGEGASHEPTEIAKAGIFALVSPDGSHAFFSSTEALTGEEENDNGEEAEAGEHNLYAWDGSQTRFIGMLTASDFEHGGFPGSLEMTLAAWTKAIGRENRAFAPTRSNPEGSAFSFQSHARLTAYDNEGMSEVYRYDASAEEGEQLLCVSCNPSGASPEGDAVLEELRHGSPVIQSTMIANVTDDGNRVFFQSFDRLLPEDANEAEDVYEWRAKGTEGPGGDACQRPGGCLALTSSGQGEANSYLFAMSADGHDVFIWTKEKLVGMDAAGSPSIYDAREGGGIPEPFVPSPCQGDDCQGNGTPPPGIPGAATTGQGEAGAPPPPSHCAKGKHKVKGRCVATKKHKHRKHRRHRRVHANRGGNR